MSMTGMCRPARARLTSQSSPSKKGLTEKGTPRRKQILSPPTQIIRLIPFLGGSSWTAMRRNDWEDQATRAAARKEFYSILSLN